MNRIIKDEYLAYVSNCQKTNLKSLVTDRRGFVKDFLELVGGTGYTTQSHITKYSNSLSSRKWIGKTNLLRFSIILLPIVRSGNNLLSDSLLNRCRKKPY